MAPLWVAPEVVALQPPGGEMRTWIPGPPQPQPHPGPSCLWWAHLCRPKFLGETTQKKTHPTNMRFWKKNIYSKHLMIPKGYFPMNILSRRFTHWPRHQENHPTHPSAFVLDPVLSVQRPTTWILLCIFGHPKVGLLEICLKKKW